MLVCVFGILILGFARRRGLVLIGIYSSFPFSRVKNFTNKKTDLFMVERFVKRRSLFLRIGFWKRRALASKAVVFSFYNMFSYSLFEIDYNREVRERDVVKKKERKKERS